MAETVKERMTAAEFAQLPEMSPAPELIKGELVTSPAPKYQHQIIVGNVYALLRAVVKMGKALLSPSDVYLDEDNVVQPDVYWVSGEGSRAQLHDDGYFHGAPDLVVEVLSPGTARIDKADKFEVYQRTGVREYWIIDPISVYLERWERDGDALAHRGVFGPAGSFISAVLGDVEIDLKRVFEE